MLAWILRIGISLVIFALIAGIWKREQITRLLAVNSLFSEEKIVSNFSNMNKMFLNKPLEQGDITP